MGLACLGLVAHSSPARADGGPVAIEIGARAGFAAPFGNVEGRNGDSLDQTIRYAAPLWVDLGVRPFPLLLVGLYATFAPGWTGDALAATCGTCSTDFARFGAQAHLHPLPQSRWDPWVGAGAGYEWLRINASQGGLTANGWELVNVQAGLDLRLAPAVLAGPFVALSLGQYDESSPSNLGHTPFADKALHQWLVLGVRGAFDWSVGVPSP
jgi:outer membrane protein